MWERQAPKYIGTDFHLPMPRLNKEPGENPGRTRRRDGGVRTHYVTEKSGRRVRAMMPQPEDLPADSYKEPRDPGVRTSKAVIRC